MKFKIETLGCKVNTYETNVMMDALLEAGYELGEEHVDIVIINTCTVTNTADKKSVKMIHQAIRKHPNAIIVVVGCLSQVNSELVQNIEGVDIVLGNVGKSKLVSYLEQYQREKKQIVDVVDIQKVPFETMALKHFDRTRAFVKIQDGCNNYCSYCVIPYARGNVRSKKKEDVLREINALVLDGHEEIVLTGIHTGHYGTELENYHFSDLLRDILTKTKVKRLRISSIEMNEITNEVLELFQNYDVLVDHMHIPIQSGSDRILKRMNRKYNKQEFIDKIKQLREIRPMMSITTDLIVGFPEEGEEEFQETLETLSMIQFSKIHVFPYSRRKHTPADRMEQVEESIKKMRVHKVMELSRQLEQRYQSKFVGTDMMMIPEVFKDGMLIGHTGNYLLVKVPGQQCLLHQMIPVRITEIGDGYCTGTLLEEVFE